MALFDFLTNEDPNQAAQFALAAGLLGGRGSFNEILGKSLMGSHVAGQNAAQIKRQTELDALQRQRFQLALDEEARKKKTFDQQQSYLNAIPEPSALGGVNWTGGQLGPTPDRVSQVTPVDPNQKLLLGGVKAGLLPLSAYITAQQKDESPLSVPAGTTLVNRKTLAPVFTNPKESPEDKDIARLKMIYGEGTPQYLDALARLGSKITTHPEGVNVSYGAPVAGVDAKGNPIFWQPDKKGGSPNIVPGIRPPDTAKSPTEFEAKAGLYFKSMVQASTVLNDIEKTNAWRPSMMESAAPGENSKTMVRTEARQKYTQAQKQWIDSINRVRSGANLPEIEYDRAVRTFFPVFGEGENIRQQKAAARAQEEQAMQAAAGKALKPQSGWSIERE